MFITFPLPIPTFYAPRRYVLHTTGAQNIPIVYNSSIRRLGMVVSVLYGAIVFREANLTKTLGASFIMLFGVMLIVSQPK